jgi:hypothetical protein
MTDLITDIWVGLRDAGMAEVMLYLADGSAYRCHWDETALIGETRVAMLADQDRKIVRIVPIQECRGIGIASPKGTDPAGYRTFIRAKLHERHEGESGHSSD